MATDWFIEQLQKSTSSPARYFTIGGSDYSDRVTKWPTIKRTSNQLKAVNLNLPLANADGALNQYYENTYLIPSSATVEIGFTHPTSGEERLSVYSGFLKNVNYSNEKCNLRLEDRLADFHTKVVGESNAPIDFSTQNPAQIAWTLCTCYGELSSIESTSNQDIDYDSWNAWSNVFSENGTETAARYEGEKVTECLSRLAKYTDSSIWVEGDGKLSFKGFLEISSLDITLDREIVKLNIDVESKRLINRQQVNWDYSVSSEYWQSNVFDQNSTSVNTFGLYEDVIQDKTIWYTNSVSALGLAQRKTNLFQAPPRRFIVNSTLAPIHRGIADTMRIVDSFFNITSASGWQITESTIDLDSGKTKYEMDEAVSANGFYLDVSCLDGDDLLL